MIKQGVLEEITILICDAPNDDDTPEVIYEAYKFTIQDSSMDQSEMGSPDDSTARSSTILINRSGKNSVQFKRKRMSEKSRTKEKNSQMQKMIGEVFEKMNEFAQKRERLPLEDNIVLKTIFTLQKGHELNKEEAEHFDIQKPLTIQMADKEKIGKVETGHHKMKISAIYNIENFKFVD